MGLELVVRLVCERGDMISSNSLCVFGEKSVISRAGDAADEADVVVTEPPIFAAQRYAVYADALFANSVCTSRLYDLCRNGLTKRADSCKDGASFSPCCTAL